MDSWEPLFDKAMLAIDSLSPHLPMPEWTIGGGTVLSGPVPLVRRIIPATLLPPGETSMKNPLLYALILGICILMSVPALAGVVVCTGPVQAGLGPTPQGVRSQATELGWTCSNGQAGTLQQISAGKRLVSYTPSMGFTSGSQSGAYPIAVFSGRGR